MHSHDYAVMLKVVIGRFKDVDQSEFAPDKEYAKKLMRRLRKPYQLTRVNIYSKLKRKSAAKNNKNKA